MEQQSSVPQRVIDYIAKRETVSIEETMQDLNVSRTTAKNYLSRLSKINTVKRIGRGLYQVEKGATATVKFSPELSRLAQDLRQRFPLAHFVIWSINMLADYAHYAIGKDLIVLETDKMLSASIRDALIEKGYHAVLRPENRDFREFAYYNEKTILVVERSEKYGLFSQDETSIPTPERIWLDTYYFITRKELSFSPSELGLIFANMLQRDGVNFNRLLRYARRRNLHYEIIIFLYNLKQSSLLPIPDNVLAGRKEALKTLREMVEGAIE